MNEFINESFSYYMLEHRSHPVMQLYFLTITLRYIMSLPLFIV